MLSIMQIGNLSSNPLPTTKLGFQIPNFTYPGVEPARLFAAVADQAVAAEESGFDTVFVMDHFFQLPGLGTPDQEMFEAYTLLGALAARTSTVRLGTLVTGVTYRYPALLAKEVTTLDVISGGRAVFGIGAAWFDLEHHSLGVRFPPLKERFEQLVDAIEIGQSMFRNPSTTYEGTHHSVSDAFNSPAPINGDIPLLIGGQGEKKTFRIAAQYAQELNMTANFTDLPRKFEALQGHLDDLGRDRADITVTPLSFLVLGETHDAAVAKMAPRLQAIGLDPAMLDGDRTVAETTLGRFIWGDADEVTDQVQRLMATGLDGLVVNMVLDHEPEMIAMAGEVLGKALGS